MGADVLVDAAAEAPWFGGGRPELERLFGSPLPALPPAQTAEGGARFPVRFHTELRSRLHRYLGALLAHLESLSSSGDVPEYEREQAHYTALLAHLLVAARRVDRRQGLPDLLWLAHSLEAARHVSDALDRNATLGPCRSLLPGYLAPVLQSVDRAARGKLTAEDPERYEVLLGDAGSGIIDGLLGEGVAFVWPGPEDMDLDAFAAAHRQARLTGSAFVEILELLEGEARRRLRERESALLARVTRALPEVDVDLPDREAARRVALHSEVLPLLIGDAWSTGRRLAELPRVRAEIARRRPVEVLDAFLQIADSLRRFTVLSALRRRVELLEGLGAEEALEEQLRSGRRLYEFSDAAQVVNTAVNATILFLDLRGFTQTSEGQVSEGGLTRELYAIFDAFAPIVRRFGGTVDKFLGDGMMVTFGTEGGGEGPLAAVRTAVLCQEIIARLRKEGATAFLMGVSIHYGRVYVARFIVDAASHQLTVIGRNVNLAGRLSSAAKKRGGKQTEHRVSVGAGGVLVNEGIALSRAALVQLEAEIDLDSRDGESDRVLAWDDEEIGGRVCLRYAGDARFKGVEASFPVFEVGHE